VGLSSGGRLPSEMATLTWAFDWASTPVGAVDTWPAALRTAVGIVLASNHPMFIWWGPELVQFYNDAYRHTMGPERHPSALGQCGRHCWEEIWPIIGPQIDSVMNGGPATWQEDQLVPVTRHGRRQDVWWTYGYSPIPDGDRVGGVLVVCTDVTDAHLHQDALLALNDRLIDEIELRRYEHERQKAMFEQAPGFMCILRGPQHVFEFANESYLRLVGDRDLIGKTLREAMPETSGQGFVKLLDQVYASGEAFTAQALPIRLRREAGAELTLRYLDFVYQPIIEADGRVSGVFVQGADITAREQAQDELIAADRRKDEFLAMLAHELRNPLAPISAAAQWLQLAVHDESKVRNASEIIGRQVQHMASLVDDLLDVSRVSRGQVHINQQPADTRMVLAEAIEQVRPLIEERQHRFEVQQPMRSPLVFGDRKRLVQVIANLLNNAARYTQPGGNICIRLEANDDSVLLVIKDNGIGIEPKLIPYVFDLFTQAKRSADRAQGGLGVGLSLVKGIVELHGGSVAVRSDGPHTGAEFTVRLPRYKEAAVVVRPYLPPMKMLIVGDSVDVAHALAPCLRSMGHDVLVEADPLRVLTRGFDEAFDVYLLDTCGSQMDGRELARCIRNNASPARPALFAITQEGPTQSRMAALGPGFDHCFQKPVDADEVITVLETLRREPTATA
jgi:PAS domain S-box-containing protein